MSTEQPEPTEEPLSISVENGKYVFRTQEGYAGVLIDRFGDRGWVHIEAGSKAVVGLMGECSEAWQEIRQLHHQLADLQKQLRYQELGA